MRNLTWNIARKEKFSEDECKREDKIIVGSNARVQGWTRSELV